MRQLEAKIVTGEHNLEIKKEKELSVLEKEISLHVGDIKRIQGLMKRLAVMKGRTQDELRRGKEKARKTMKQIKDARNADPNGSTQGKSKTSATGLGSSTMAALQTPEDSPINLLLFGNTRKSAYGGMTSSLGNTSASSASSA
jgi:hypothetical protein